MKIIHLNLEDWMSDFDLEKAVCNHGMFMMPPNKWIVSSKTLQRPLRLSNSNTSVLVSINQSSSSLLTIQIHSPSNSTSHTPPKDQQAILDQVVRMLRITQKDEDDLRKFQNMHPRAKEIGFGRIFRAPTLFEDIVKSILLCNCSWKRTLGMAEALCELQGKMSNELLGGNKRKRKGEKYDVVGGGNFPNAKEVCRIGVELLKKHSLGYRAPYIIKFAKSVENGTIDLKTLDQQPLLSLSPNANFPKMKGFGPFAIANILMCLGFYHQLPVDTETIRHLKQVHGREFCNKKTVDHDVKQLYDKYAPFQCLAYWLELVDYYESKFGKLSELCSLDYYKISGSKVNF